MKVLLINPRATYAGEIAQKCYPPLNLMYLAAALRARGHDARIVDANAVNMPDGQIAAEAAVYAPGLIGMPLFSTITAHVFRASTLLRERCTSARLVLGGPEASALPERTLQSFAQADFVLRGESEESICSLCDALERGDGLAEIKGLTYRQDGRIVGNPDVTPERDLDRVCRPARDLTEEHYRAKRYYSILVKARPVDTIITSRGCPFHCGFCYNQSHVYRFRSPEDVVDEVHGIVRRGIRDIEVCDDSFTIRRERAMRIFDLFIRERLGVSFRIKSRVNAVDREFLAKARRAGVYLVSYGVESGVQAMLDRMNKRTTVAENAQAIRLTKEAGMMCHASFVLGYPGETPDTISQTVDFIRATKPSTVNLVVLVPFPQTEVYHYAKEKGMLVGDWEAQSRYVPWVRLPWMESRADLDRIAQVARRKVYVNPHYIAAFTTDILRNANLSLAEYAAKEALKLVRTQRQRLF